MMETQAVTPVRRRSLMKLRRISSADGWRACRRSIIRPPHHQRAAMGARMTKSPIAPSHPRRKASDPTMARMKAVSVVTT